MRSRALGPIPAIFRLNCIMGSPVALFEVFQWIGFSVPESLKRTNNNQL